MPIARQLALITLLSACAASSPQASPEELRQARAMQPSPGNAVLYVLREQTRPAGWGDTVFLDGRLEGTLRNGDFFRFVLAPGPHELGASIGTSLDEVPCQPQASFTARAGDTLLATALGGASRSNCPGVAVFLDDGTRAGGPAVGPSLLRALKTELPGANLLLPSSAGRVVAARAPAAPADAAPAAPAQGPALVATGKSAPTSVKTGIARPPSAVPAAPPSVAAGPVSPAPAAAGAARPEVAGGSDGERAKIRALELRGLRSLLSRLPPGPEAEKVRARLALAEAEQAMAAQGASAEEIRRSLQAGAPAPAAVTPAPDPATTRPPVATATPLPEFARGATQPTAFALVIGVERYRDLPAPTGARADAERFVQLAKTTLGVPERHILVALDDRATRSDLEKHLAWLERNVPAGGRIYVFFAGHGAPEPASGTSYLLPYDADPAALSGTAVKLSDLTARLGRTKARDVVAFLDSCFSGTGGRSVIAAGVRPLVPVQKLASAPRVSILAAVTGAQVTGASRSGSGLFSQFLLEGLGTGKADLDGDAQITLKELHDWVAPRVKREAGLDNRDQLPSLTAGKGVDAASCFVATGVTGG